MQSLDDKADTVALEMQRIKDKEKFRSRIEWIIAGTFIIAGVGWVTKAVIFLAPKLGP